MSSMPRRTILFALVASSLLGVAGSVARLSAEEPGRGVADGGMPLRVTGDRLALRLDEAIEMALRQNLSLSIERRAVREAELAIDENRGIYDLGLESRAEAQDQTSPAASNLDGAPVVQESSQVFSIGLRQLTPLGGEVSASWFSRRGETNSAFAILNPSYVASLGLNFRQPLLRNFGRIPTERSILVARNRAAISRDAFEQQATRVIQDVQNAYWDVVEAMAQLEVAQQGLELARELHEMNRVRVEVGTLAPLELVQSEVGVATREEEIIRAQANLEDASDRLRTLLNLERGPAWELDILPETDPETDRMEIDLAQAIATALETRPELRSRRLVSRNLEIDAAYFQNQRRPNLDLVLGYSFSGLGGDVLFRDSDGNVIGVVEGGLSDAMDQIRDRDFSRWSVGVTLSLPIQDRAARARSAAGQVALERSRLELEDLRLGIRSEVRTAARRVDTSAKQIDSARISRRLAERNLEAEQKRYESGLSTSFQVLQIQEDLTAARSREVSAITGYRRALAEYYRAIGRLVEEQGIELEG